MDAYAHVNNARYLEFLEDARWEILEKHIGLEKLQAKGIIFVVVNINISYRKPAAMGDILELYLGLEKISSKSAVFHQELRLQGTATVVADAQVTFVFADVNSGKAVRIDDDLKGLLEELKTPKPPSPAPT